MIQKVGQIMVYVNDQDKAAQFWTEIMGFRIIADRDKEEEHRGIEIGPANGAETSIMLYNKDFVARMSPGVTLGTPSLMFISDQFDQLHANLKEKEIKVGDIVQLPGGRVFNFADFEDNYFAVMESNEA
ncbi:glyoxalase [Paenibacillus oryzae]|uniref:Glyoxalase n=1 Tax=Paenibacillus oryzae TaxID=1844972 RepID=A0A1A5YIY1_9BACL|nr:VOC family protein [Paenibacillus oryzae]OBR65523.1 glyoxalase [Paenibacillus oryzae]